MHTRPSHTGSKNLQGLICFGGRHDAGTTHTATTELLSVAGCCCSEPVSPTSPLQHWHRHTLRNHAQALAVLDATAVRKHAPHAPTATISAPSSPQFTPPASLAASRIIALVHSLRVYRARHRCLQGHHTGRCHDGRAAHAHTVARSTQARVACIHKELV